ncbi:MAG: hypothetical protein GKR89_23920 [Candidatus Latescibacteria bacterium]|nr:hypothetical protein [Candidatus Latescibacterota bacterium]
MLWILVCAIALASCRSTDSSGLDLARQATALIEDPFLQAAAWISLSKGLAAAGDTTAGKHALEQALAATGRIDSVSVRSSANLSRAFKAAGDPTAALEIGQVSSWHQHQHFADRLPPDLLRVSALTSIAQAQLNLDDTSSSLTSLTQALDRSQGLQPPQVRDQALNRMVWVALAAGDTAQAHQLIATMEDDWRRGWSIQHIARTQLRSGDADAALQTALNLTGPHRANALGELAQIHIDSNSISAAAGIAALIEDDRTHTWTLHNVARAQLTAGDTLEALQTLVLARAAADRIYDLHSRVTSLRLIGQTQLAAGSSPAGRQTLAASLVAAQEINSLLLRVGALGELSQTQLASGDTANARDILTLIRQAIEMADNAVLGHMAQDNFVQTLGEMGYFGAANQAIEQMQAPSDRSAARRKIARAQLAAGDTLGARRNLDRALGRAQSEAGNAFGRAFIMTDIVAILTAAGDSAAARSLLDQALELAQSVDSPTDRSWNWLRFANSQMALGDTATALALILTIEDENVRSSALEKVAHKELARGDTSAALTTVRRLRQVHLLAPALTEIASVQLTAGNTSSGRTSLTEALAAARRIEEVHQRDISLLFISAVSY